jgi:hypothetical protein
MIMKLVNQMKYKKVFQFNTSLKLEKNLKFVNIFVRYIIHII